MSIVLSKGTEEEKKKFGRRMKVFFINEKKMKTNSSDHSIIVKAFKNGYLI